MDTINTRRHTIIVVLNRNEANTSSSFDAINVTNTGFSINRDDAVSNPAPFTWIAINQTLTAGGAV